MNYVPLVFQEEQHAKNRRTNATPLFVLYNSFMSRLTPADALERLRSDDLPSLGANADAVTQRLHPGNVRTYNVERNINYTNVCVDRKSVV